MLANVKHIFPMTEMQKGMLFHSVMEPNSGIYCEQFMFEIRGSIDFSRLDKAWRGVVRENDILRISAQFKSIREPVQIVHRVVENGVSTVDFSESGEKEFLERLDALLTTDRHRGFNFSSPELIRATLIKRGGTNQILLLTYHHLILDAWSLFLLMKELVEHYDTGGSVGKVDAFYLEYVRSLRNEGGRLESDRFWKDYLMGYQSVTQVADKFPGGQFSRNSLDTHFEVLHRVSEDLSQQLLQVSRQTGFTLNTLIQGAWGLTVAEASGDNDVVFGITITHRPHTISNIDKMVGIFINSLPKRIRIRREVQLREYLEEIQNDQARIKKFEHVPLPEIQILSDIRGGQPIFQTLLIFENFLKSPAWEQGSEFTVRHYRYVGWTNYPLAIEAMPPADDKPLFFQVKFDSNYFSEARVKHLLESMKQKLASMISDLHRPISELILTRATVSAENAIVRTPPEARQAGSDLEREIANIWRRILGRQELDFSQTFFEAGGHSLLLFRLQAELHSHFGVEIELVDLFDSPTIGRQAIKVQSLLDMHAST